jgi:hypothetical protein
MHSIILEGPVGQLLSEVVLLLSCPVLKPRVDVIGQVVDFIVDLIIRKAQ